MTDTTPWSTAVKTPGRQVSNLHSLVTSVKAKQREAKYLAFQENGPEEKQEPSVTRNFFLDPHTSTYTPPHTHITQ